MISPTLHVFSNNKTSKQYFCSNEIRRNDTNQQNGSIISRKDELVKVEAKSRQQKSRNIRQYFFSRFFTYISNYDAVLENRFPKAIKIYRVFMVGVKDFYSDMKRYYKINSIMSEKGLRALTRKEMELHHQMPKDIMKVAPVLLISALPFANYVVFPLA